MREHLVERRGGDQAEIARAERRPLRLRRRDGAPVLQVDLLPAEFQREARLAVRPAKRLAREAERALVEPRRRLDVGDGQNEVIDAVGEQGHERDRQPRRRLAAQAPAERQQALVARRAQHLVGRAHAFDVAPFAGGSSRASRPSSRSGSRAARADCCSRCRRRSRRSANAGARPWPCGRRSSRPCTRSSRRSARVPRGESRSSCAPVSAGGTCPPLLDESHELCSVVALVAVLERQRVLRGQQLAAGRQHPEVRRAGRRRQACEELLVHVLVADVDLLDDEDVVQARRRCAASCSRNAAR